MEDIIEIYKSQLEIKEKKLFEITEKIFPLQKEREGIEKDIQALKQLIGSNDKTIPKTGEQSLGEKAPMEAYEELGRDYFKDNSFKEPNIRELATQKGLEVNGKPISGSYSRAIITRLIERGTFERVKSGVYRYHQQGEEQELQLRRRKIRMPIHIDE